MRIKGLAEDVSCRSCEHDVHDVGIGQRPQLINDDKAVEKNLSMRPQAVAGPKLTANCQGRKNISAKVHRPCNGTVWLTPRFVDVRPVSEKPTVVRDIAEVRAIQLGTVWSFQQLNERYPGLFAKARAPSVAENDSKSHPLL